MADSNPSQSGQRPDQLEGRYDPQTIEKKWGCALAADPELLPSNPSDKGKKYYVADVAVSLGRIAHGTRFVTTPSATRWRRLQVDARAQRPAPMGWERISGLPAENAAIKNNTPPRDWTLGKSRT